MLDRPSTLRSAPIVARVQGTRSWPALVAIVCAAAFLVITFRHGHSWGSDFAQYIAHARNIVTGRPYSETGYIYNPHYPMAPPVYPPVFPLMLAPIYAVRGVDLPAMQALVLTSFIAFLVVFDRHCKRRLSSPVSRVAVVASVGFSPWYWDYKEEILSDFPFMLFFFLAIVLLDRTLASGRSSAPEHGPDPPARASRSIGLCLIAGLSVYLACGTRTVGVVLLPAAFVFSYLANRSFPRSLFIATAVWVLLFGVHNLLWHVETAYGTVVRDAVHSPLLVNSDLGIRLRGYIGDMHRYWGGHAALQRVMVVLSGSLAAIGWVALLRSRSSLAETIVPIYALALVVTPFKDAQRYLFPMVPLYLLYVFRGVESLPIGRTSLRRFVLPGVLAALVAVAYVSAYGQLRFSNLSHGVDTRASRELFDFVATRTPRDAVFIFDKPRALALFTERRAAIYHVAPAAGDLWAWFDRIGMTHLVDRYAGYQPEKAWRATTYRELITAYRDRLQLVFENDEFRVYERGDR